MGITLGFACGLIGIGGGVLMVPVMATILKFKMHSAVGTSTAMMIFTSIGGAISYMLDGLNVSGLPPILHRIREPATMDIACRHKCSNGSGGCEGCS